GGGPMSDLGVVGVGHSTDRTLTVSNVGGAGASAIAFAALSPPYSWSGGAFPGTGGTCTTTLASGTSCAVVITVAPTTGGTFATTGQATFNDGSATQSARRSLTGQGIDAAYLVVSDWSGGGGGGSAFDFGTWGVPVDHTFYVSNGGSKSAVSMTGIAPAAPF